MLNYQSFLLEHIDDDSSIDEAKVELLAKLVNKYNTRIVLSSSRRIRFTKSGNIRDKECKPAKELKRLFKKYKLAIFGKTKDYHNKWYDYYDAGFRADEIEEYIKNNLTEEDNFVIFDDEDFSGTLFDFREHFIMTSWQRGLTEKNIKEAEYVLQKDRR